MIRRGSGNMLPVALIYGPQRDPFSGGSYGDEHRPRQIVESGRFTYPRRMAATGRLPMGSARQVNGWFRRVLPVAAYSGDGLLSEPTAAAQPGDGNCPSCPAAVITGFFITGAAPIPSRTLVSYFASGLAL